MSGRVLVTFRVVLAVVVGLFLLSQAEAAKDKDMMMLFSPKGSGKTQGKSDKALPEIPDNLDQAKINEIVAGLNDDQVRRLLLQELEKAAAANVKKEQPKKASGLARIVQIAEENTTLFQKRLSDIRSGAVAVPEFLPKAYAELRGKGGTSNILLMFAGVLALLAAGVGAEWLFGRRHGRYAKTARTAPPAHWTVKIKRLVLCRGHRIHFALCFLDRNAGCLFPLLQSRTLCQVGSHDLPGGRACHPRDRPAFAPSSGTRQPCVEVPAVDGLYCRAPFTAGLWHLFCSWGQVS